MNFWHQCPNNHNHCDLEIEVASFSLEEAQCYIKNKSSIIKKKTENTARREMQWVFT